MNTQARQQYDAEIRRPSTPRPAARRSWDAARARLRPSVRAAWAAATPLALVCTLLWLIGLAGARPALAQQGAAAWLDALTAAGAETPAWNTPGMALPKPPAGGPFGPAECRRRERQPETAEEEALVAAGWRLLQAWPAAPPMGAMHVTIIMATADHDGMCRPLGYNAFVFAGGAFAGTVAPAPMTSRQDGALAAPPRFLPDGRLEARFVRYALSDPLCCPSRPPARVAYRVVGTEAGPVLLPDRQPAPTPGVRLPSTGSGPGEDPACYDSV